MNPCGLQSSTVCGYPLAMNVCPCEQSREKAKYQRSKHTLLQGAMQPIITVVFLLRMENTEACIQTVT